MNLLSTLVLIPLLNPLLRYGGIEGESSEQIKDKGVNNYFTGHDLSEESDTTYNKEET